MPDVASPDVGRRHGPVGSPFVPSLDVGWRPGLVDSPDVGSTDVGSPDVDLVEFAHSRSTCHAGLECQRTLLPNIGNRLPKLRSRLTKAMHRLQFSLWTRAQGVAREASKAKDIKLPQVRRGAEIVNHRFFPEAGCIQFAARLFAT